jgi:hypothetical protein
VQDNRNICRVLIRKPNDKRRIKRSRYGWNDNIKKILKKEYVRAWTVLIWLRIEESKGLSRTLFHGIR